MRLKNKIRRNLLSRTTSHAVPSVIQALTSLFEMGRGVTPVFNHQNKKSILIPEATSKLMLKTLPYQ